MLPFVIGTIGLALGGARAFRVGHAHVQSLRGFADIDADGHALRPRSAE